MKQERVILTKEEIFDVLDQALKIGKKSVKYLKEFGRADFNNVLFYSEESVDYLPTIEEWAYNNNINLVVTNTNGKNDYSQYELEDLKKENTVLVFKNIYYVNTEFLNRRLLSTIENHSIINNKIMFNNLIFVIGLNDYNTKSPDMKLTSFFGHYGYNYIDE